MSFFKVGCDGRVGDIHRFLVWCVGVQAPHRWSPIKPYVKMIQPTTETLTGDIRAPLYRECRGGGGVQDLEATPALHL